MSENNLIVSSHHPEDEDWVNDKLNPLNWPAGKKAILVAMGSATAFTTLVLPSHSLGADGRKYC